MAARTAFGHDGGMRNWNGWGDDSVSAPLGKGRRAFVADRLGPGTPPREASLTDLVTNVQPSRLADSPGVRLSIDAELRVRRARGQSLPDLIALRTGRLEAVPDAVARPETSTDVRRLLAYAESAGAHLIPYGGGTSVTGGVSAYAAPVPLITADMSRLAGIRDVDEKSGLVTVAAGTTGPALATGLAGRGLTVGHEPQSFEFATVGGWVAARGAGLRSLGVGRMEDIFAGGTLEAPTGTMDMQPFPASAAGPDLRHVVLGSEGRLGFLTDVILRANPYPELDLIDAYAVPEWDHALEAARDLVRGGVPLSMLRLSTAAETRTLMGFSDKPRDRRLLNAYLGLRRKPTDFCLVLLGTAGRRRPAKAARAEAASVLKHWGGVKIPGVAAAWQRSRFQAPYLRSALWSEGYASDTLETATTWAAVPRLLSRMETAIAGSLAPWNERVWAFTHLSHLYPSGASLYTTFMFRLAQDPDETLARWRSIKRAATEAIAAEHATISHHHGIGTDLAAYLPAEKGDLGIHALRSMIHAFDPEGIMNPGVLLADR
jgi:alkyldihydroxyacetonephosphate synthase